MHYLLRFLKELALYSRYIFYRGVYDALIGSIRFEGYCRIYGKIYIQDHPCRIRIGKGVLIGRGVFLASKEPARISVGAGSSINSYCHLVSSKSISIGSSVAIAEFVSIRDQEHVFSVESGVRGQGYNTGSIVIEDRCWIGRGAYIGPGTHIREGSIVGANAVVRGDFPPFSLIAGVPGSVRKNLAKAGENKVA